MVLCIGSLMTLGLLSRGQQLITLVDGNLFNTWQKDRIKILLYLLLEMGL